MKLLYNAGAVVSLVFVAVGFFQLWKLGLLGTGLSVCILGLITAPSLSMGLYLLQLRQRITALENRAQEPK